MHQFQELKIVLFEFRAEFSNKNLNTILENFYQKIKTHENKLYKPKKFVGKNNGKGIVFYCVN